MFRLIFRSFSYYWRAHVAVILGAAVSTMVLTGTLMVGDSVESSLEKTTELRLGNTHYVFSGIDRFFRSALAVEIADSLNISVAPILQLNGIASSEGGALKAYPINIVGIDEQFENIIPGNESYIIPDANEAFISENLANRLSLKEGDDFLLRIEKISLIPKNAPFVSETDNQISLRLKVGQILGPEKLGRFNLKTSQTAPFNVFLSLAFLNDRMGSEGKTNHLLIEEKSGTNAKSIFSAIKNYWKIEDLGLKVINVNQGKQWEIRSDRVFIDSMVMKAVSKVEDQPDWLLTYFANSLQIGDRKTPYSFISAGPFLPENNASHSNDILINSWLAEDLSAVPGDSIRISYYTIGPLRKLHEKIHWFKIKDIVPMTEPYTDKTLMPSIPGLTDVDNCREWETGIPIDLDQIRDKDEDYWNIWRGTPKAFINYSTGKKLWENRFGACTAIRLSAEEHTEQNIRQQLSDLLDPENFGFNVKAVKAEGLTSARGGVDFSQLFMGLSFFLLIAGLTLMALLFNLHLEKRMSEIGTLKALGYSGQLIRRLILIEGLFVAIPGVILGGFLAIVYNKLVFMALNTVWYEIVRTTILQADIRITTLTLGMIIGLLLAWLTMLINVFRKLKTKPARLQRSVAENKHTLIERFLRPATWLLGITAFALVGYEIMEGDNLNTAIFFSAGGILLIFFILFLAQNLRRQKKKSTVNMLLTSLAFDNLRRNHVRSIRIIILFALGTFVTLSTGLNQKDLYKDAYDKNSGTGGFLFFGETTLPVLLDLNDPESKTKYGLELPLNFIQMRKSEGDDASCLNLNRVSQPRILGFQSQFLEGRFSFIRETDEMDPAHPWTSLEKKLPGGIIPAIADQTVIQWGLGKKVGDTLIYRNEQGQEMRLKLIGGLANSIFQGNVLIDEKHFLEHFPSSSGTHILLVEGDLQSREEAAKELERVFRNDGLELSYAADRLARFNEVENTYLSIFMLLGGLAMILGTVGLGVSLARNILDRRREFAVMRAIGYQIKSILKMITGEYMILLILGTMIGAITALVATLPALLSVTIEASWQIALLLIFLILLNGLIWILIVAWNNIRKNLLESLRQE